jgi:hypothetical protein
MKKISILSLAFFVAMASFANFAPSRLTVSAIGKNNIRVTVDEKKMNGQSGYSGSTFENLAPGYHSVRVYQYGRMVYSAAVQIKPMYALSIVLDNHGNAIIDEQPIKSNNDCNIQYGGTISYDPGISYGDYTGIKTMMANARFDEQRLQIAKKAVDENLLAAIQIKEMAKLFKTESAQLEFAKYAYGKTADKNNYSLVCNTFPFGDNKADLTNYIRNYR